MAKRKTAQERTVTRLANELRRKSKPRLHPQLVEPADESPDPTFPTLGDEELLAQQHAEELDALGSDPEPPEPGESPEDDAERKQSIVKPKFKHRYIEHAKELGTNSKIAKRSNWDWLSQQLAAFCLDSKGKINIDLFTDVLEANGVDHSKWNRTVPGWQGRLRMTGRVALQKRVAESGKLLWPNDLEPSEAPQEWRNLYLPKE